MPLQQQQLDVGFGGGMNTKTDPRQLPPGQATQIINGRRQTRDLIVKRPGTIYLPRTSTETIIAGGAAKGAAWVFDGAAMQVYSDALQSYASPGLMPEAQVRDRLGVLTSSGVATVMHEVVSSGYRLVVYPNSFQYAVVDAITNATVVPQTSANVLYTSVDNFTCFLCGTTAVLVYAKSGDLYAQTMDMTNPVAGWSLPTTIVGLFSSYPQVFDAAPMTGDPTRFLIGYEGVGGTYSAIILVYTVAGLTLSATYQNETTTVNSGFQAMAVCGTSGGYFHLAYAATAGSSGGTTNVLRAWSVKDGGSSYAIDTIYTWGSPPTYPGPMAVTQVPSLGVNYVCVSWSNLPLGLSNIEIGSATYAFTGFHTAAAILGGGYTLYGQQNIATNVSLASKPQIIGSLAYAVFWFPSILQGTYFLCALDWWGTLAETDNSWSPRVVCQFATRLAKSGVLGAVGTILPYLISEPALDGTVYSFPFMLSTNPFTSAGYVQQFDFQPYLCGSSADPYGWLPVGIAMGQQQEYDSQRPFESNFSYYPEPRPNGAAGSATGGSMATGSAGDVYQYIIIYEAYDALGNKHWSGTSNEITADMSGLGSGTSGSVVLTLPTQGLTSRRPVRVAGISQQANPSAIYAIPYRTAPSVSVGVYYRTVSDPPPAACLMADGVMNFTVTDTLADASLTDGTHAVLYTTGGVLDNYAPPGGRIRIVHKGRWWVSGCDDPTAIWPSQQFISGQAPGWNEALAISASGAVRALQSMDDKIVIFVQRGTQYGIEYMTGEGPDPTGGNSDWTPPQAIPCDVGALDQRGTVVTPMGILFKSPVGGPNNAGGMYLLTRDLQVQYVGQALETLFDPTTNPFPTPIVTSMVLHPTAGRVYVTLVDSDTASTVSVRAVWDYTMDGVWSVDSLNDLDQGYQGPIRTGFVANASTGSGAQATYHYGSVAGRLYRENMYDQQDGAGENATFVQTIVQTGYIRGSLQGVARWWRALVKGSASSGNNAGLQITLTFDDVDNYSEVTNFTDAQVAAFDRYPDVQAQVIIGNQVAQSIQVTLQDTAPETLGIGTGAGLGFLGVSLTVGIDGGKPYPNLPARQRA